MRGGHGPSSRRETPGGRPVRELGEEELDRLRVGSLVDAEERVAVPAGEQERDRLVGEDHELLDEHVRARLVLRPRALYPTASVERELDLAPLGDFYAPNEIVEETLGWREIGMPEELIAIASDGMGNKFCFDSKGLKRGTADGKAVWFFDHDFDTTEVIASSFDAWIGALCAVEALPD